MLSRLALIGFISFTDLFGWGVESHLNLRVISHRSKEQMLLPGLFLLYISGDIVFIDEAIAFEMLEVEWWLTV